MPGSLEEYVQVQTFFFFPSMVSGQFAYDGLKKLNVFTQEIGRAGRDGRLSYCHLFYDEDTYLKLRSLSHR